MNRIRVGILSVVPSPYQRDLFAALAGRDDLSLQVYYLERRAPDSPWPEAKLAAYEKILPGFWIPFGSARCHINRGFPPPENFDLIICNTLVSWTAQSLLRALPSRQPWIFWGERLRRHSSGWRCRVQDWLCAPLGRAAAIAGVGTGASDDYRRRFPAVRHFSIPYYCNLKPFVAARANPGHSPHTTFLFCGQMIRRKGIDLLLQAFERLCQKNLPVRLLLVGREAELPAWLAALPSEVRAQVEYAGFQPPEKLPAYFSRADVFILPSRYEGWGVVVNQALGAGLPLLCSDAVGAGYDLIEEGVNGTRFPAGSVEAIEQKMEALIKTPGLIKAWGRASAQKSVEWTPEKGSAKWAKAIQIAISKA
jgi:glycosyltransferase involved in cell wall biosynthesis